jgi:hypothetical protein
VENMLGMLDYIVVMLEKVMMYNQIDYLKVYKLVN